jgi:hypothetical protein
MEANTMTKKLTSEEKKQRLEDRRAARKLEAEAARIEAEKSQRPVKCLTITIEWRKSRMWGSNPHAEAKVEFWPIAGQDNYDRRGGYTCGGCGYDKESTVIAEIFNHYLKYKLWQKTPENARAGVMMDGYRRDVYGVSFHENGNHRYYAGGIGTSCYEAISVFIGGKWEKIASGSTFDVYQYMDNEPTAEVNESCK